MAFAAGARAAAGDISYRIMSTSRRGFRYFAAFNSSAMKRYRRFNNLNDNAYQQRQYSRHRCFISARELSIRWIFIDGEVMAVIDLSVR